ncbi:hypothetical protein GGU10DRAFT_381718 [Lentinula aff. detonsa]|uniref:Uncharacterized protein n=1 Tax=Lentinula aff. detonsa TaxID=2804958 RepID=A0AA38KMK2_9AGAR|nr:hypothetical protein GGU10DRAFT_381718 [Lentinula aff. detonsa]
MLFVRLAVASSRQAKDPYIVRAAMDRSEHVNSATSVSSKRPREEPTTFFYIVFGLVYEALAEASTDSLTSSAARRTSVIASLQVLKSLVEPKYAGKAILDPTILDYIVH